MNFRTRLLVTFLLAVLLPMIALALFIRHEMTDRLTAQYERRVESLVSVIDGDLSQESETIATSLAVLGKTLIDDNRFRRGAVDRAEDERRYVLDYAGNAMRLAGLSMLQIQDESGRIISSGHFRNEYDRMEEALPRLLGSIPDGAALVQARAPDAPFLALVRGDSVQIGSRRFTIVAGIRVEKRFLTRLSRGDELAVTLVHPGGALISGPDRPEVDVSSAQTGTQVPRVSPDTETPRSSVTASPDAGMPLSPVVDSADAIVRKLNVPFIDSERGEIAHATFRVSHQLAGLQALRSSIDRWFLIAVAAAALFAVMLVASLASRISRPLAELADKTSRIDLDRLDIDFRTRRKDEIGALSRLLGAMTERLRASTILIKDAEHRATLGELSRQVTHDIKNGLTPIRNVFRHLFDLSRDDPRQLPEVFQERQSTLDSSISYLENLASNYARLSPRSERRPCDVNTVIRRVVTDLQGSDRVSLETNLCDRAVVLGDPVALRRVLENLIDNAIDSLKSGAGTVTITTELVPGDADRSRVRIAVADTGVGIGEEQLARVFDDFYTTKDDGVGLGLSIVRRLVMDLDGSIQVESEKGKGSRFVIDMPAEGVA